MTVTTRRLVRSAAGTAFVLALAVGCGAGDDQAETPAEQPQQTQQTDDTGASDGGGAAEESPAASDGGGAAAADSDLPADADLATTELPIPAEDAVQRALDAAGGGDVHTVTIDHDRRNGWEWEIEIRNGTEEHDIELSAITGEVIEHERDQDDDGEPAVDVTSPMPYAEAIELALGAQDGRVSGWSLDSDDGRVHYGVDIVPAGSNDDVDVVVDVETKDVRIDD
ncbi:PepSY domain-containing protein [Brachybacterium muris]|uniref:PepSY domain-containing protein n=1 Tax=Brachybacterium muris TaxID=219301 RepID=UPI00223B320E|nr:PepSY domain-containing protein [Brachybacterium muris]MCT2178218.1 PepSY domain-containing protein [Brachybacterium muris]